MITNPRFNRVVLSAALLSTMVPLAIAQQSSGQKNLVLEELIVTAQRREQSLQDTPVAVTAFTASSIEERGITNTLDIMDSVPNLSIGGIGANPTAAGMTIRGLGGNDPQLTSDVKVGMYLDGVYMARMTNAAFNLAEIERIEVLRGPQGTLFGRNSTGGAVNIVTKKPTGEWGFKQEVTIGNRGRTRSVTAINTEEMAGVSASFSYLNTGYDGDVENIATTRLYPDIATGDGGEMDTDGYKIALRWMPSEDVTVDLSYSDVDTDGFGAANQVTWANAGLIPFIPGFADIVAAADENRKNSVALNGLGPDTTETRNTNLTIEWDLGGATLKSITGLSEWDHEGYSDNDGAESILPFASSTRVESQEQKTQEFQINGSALNDSLEYVTGLFYFEEQTTSFGAGNSLGSQSSRISDTDYSSWGIYGQGTWAMNDRLSLTLGLRYGEDDKKAEQLLSDIAVPVIGEDDWSNVSYTAIADYQWNDDISTYFKVSTGYNAGGFNIRDTAIDPVTGLTGFETPVDEETLTTYELGMKAEFMDNRVRLNSAVFYTDFEDMQISEVPDQTTCLGVAFCLISSNAGGAEMKGVEIELEAVITEALSLQASYAYIDAEITEFILDDGTDATEGKVFPFTPENSASLSLVYDFPATGIGQFSARIDANYQDEMAFSSQDTNGDRYFGDSRTLVNARLTLADIPVAKGNLRLALWGKNLTDEEYRKAGLNLTIITNNYYGELRSYGLDLIYNL